MIRIEEIGAAERERYTQWLESSPRPDFRQTFEWGEVRRREGWVARRFLALQGGEIVSAFLVLQGRLPHLPFNVMCVPAGPIADLGSAEVTVPIADHLRSLAREMRADFVRVEPSLSADDAFATKALLGAGFVPAGIPWSFWNAPREVLRVDLSPSEDCLFRHLSKGKRYGVRLFARKGYTAAVSESISDYVAFQCMVRELGETKGFLVRGSSYWDALWTELVGRGRGALIAARSHERLLGGALLVFCGPACFLLHAADDPAASKSSERPNDALYWASIQYARSRGCRLLDMMGYVSASHLSFKLNFGAKLEKLMGYFDLIVSPARYRFFSALERQVLPWAVPLVARVRFGHAAGEGRYGRQAGTDLSASR